MIVFFGTSGHSVLFLEELSKTGFAIDEIVSAPPKPIGRKHILTENPVVSFAKKNNIVCKENKSDLLKEQKPDLGIILDFNQIIPQSIIDHFQKGIINIHFSKLPRYRGACPVQNTILNGDKEAWITYYLITAGLDDGPILIQTPMPLTNTETTEDLYTALCQKAAREIGKVVEDYLANKITPMPQAGQPTMTKKLNSENCRIDWKKSDLKIDRLIRAAYPEPGAWATTQLKTESLEPVVKRIKILKAHLEQGKLIPDLVQLEGKNPVSWKQFKEGYPQSEFKQ